MASLVADRRIWLTADRSRAVEEGDVAAAFLLVGPGEDIPSDDVERLGLSSAKGRIVLPAAAAAAAVVEETEASPAAPEKPPKPKRRKKKGS